MSGWLGCTTFSDLSSLSSFPNSSSKKGSWKEIRTLAFTCPKALHWLPHHSIWKLLYSWLLIYRIFRKRFHSTLYLSLTMRFIGDQILGWLYLKSIRLKGTHQPEVPPKNHKPCRPMAYVSYWSQTKIGLEGSIVFSDFSDVGLSSYNLKIGFCLAVHSTVPPARFFPLWKNLFGRQEEIRVEIMVFWWLHKALHFLRWPQGIHTKSIHAARHMLPSWVFPGPPEKRNIHKSK